MAVVQAQWAYREKQGSLTMKEIFNKVDPHSDDVITESELYAVRTAIVCKLCGC